MTRQGSHSRGLWPRARCHGSTLPFQGSAVGQPPTAGRRGAVLAVIAQPAAARASWQVPGLQLPCRVSSFTQCPRVLGPPWRPPTMRLVAWPLTSAPCPPPLQAPAMWLSCPLHTRRTARRDAPRLAPVCSKCLRAALLHTVPSFCPCYTCSSSHFSHLMAASLYPDSLVRAEPMPLASWYVLPSFPMLAYSRCSICAC